VQIQSGRLYPEAAEWVLGRFRLERVRSFGDAGFEDVVAGTHLDKNLGSDRFVVDEQTEEQMLGSHVVVAQLQRLRHGALDRGFRSRGKGNPAFFGGCSSFYQRQYPGLDRGSRDAGFSQNLGCQTVGGVEQREKEVLGSHESVAEAMGLFLRLRKDCSCAICESLERRDIEGESLVGRLLADPQGTAYLRPRATVAPALVYEVSKQRIGGLFEIGRGL